MLEAAIIERPGILLPAHSPHVDGPGCGRERNVLCREDIPSQFVVRENRNIRAELCSRTATKTTCSDIFFLIATLLKVISGIL